LPQLPMVLAARWWHWTSVTSPCFPICWFPIASHRP